MLNRSRRSMESFWSAVKDIFDHNVLDHLSSYPAHSPTEHAKLEGSGRFAHSVRVGYLSFVLSKLFRCDPVVCARAGLLHDVGYDVGEAKNPLKQVVLHAGRGAALARKMGESAGVVSAIESHMFPIGSPPRTIEAVVVWLADKLDAALDLIGMSPILESFTSKILEAMMVGRRP